MKQKINTDINGIKVKKLKSKKKKRGRNDRSNSSTCPLCLSKLTTNSLGVLECTGDRLQIWEKEFAKFHKMSPTDQVEYVKSISTNTIFQDLYDRWVYSFETDPQEKFECGYTNTLFPPIGTVKVCIPDPIFVKRLQEKLGRQLTEEELIGEHFIYSYKGTVGVFWHKNAKKIRIPYVVLPDEIEVYV